MSAKPCLLPALAVHWTNINDTQRAFIISSSRQKGGSGDISLDQSVDVKTAAAATTTAATTKVPGSTVPPLSTTSTASLRARATTAATATEKDKLDYDIGKEYGLTAGMEVPPSVVHSVIRGADQGNRGTVVLHIFHLRLACGKHPLTERLSHGNSTLETPSLRILLIQARHRLPRRIPARATV